MISDQLSKRIHELMQGGEPCVTATVVRAQRPTSAAPGSVALIHGDGTIEGFVGGVCAEQSVRVYSLKAIDSGEPLLLRILPEAGESAGADSLGSSAGAELLPEAGESAGADSLGSSAGAELLPIEDGAVTVKNPCLSGGALEIFLEPLLPAPRLRVAGESLIAASLRSLGPELGLEVSSVSVDAGPQAGDLALVIAAHGRDELGALRAGVELGVPYVGLVASPRRGATVLEELRASGMTEEALARIDTPAGLDIGARTPGEVALSILVQIVQVRRSGGPLWGPLGKSQNDSLGRAQTAIDPICGMTVVVGATTPVTQRGSETVYFCCDGCQRTYEAQAA